MTKSKVPWLSFHYDKPTWGTPIFGIEEKKKTKEAESNQPQWFDRANRQSWKESYSKN